MFTNSENFKTGACYIRVSTDKQEELSPDAQKRLILEYARKQGVAIPERYIFLENGISGKKAKKRPQFQQMIAIAKLTPRQFDVIYVWKFSRFARNQEESIVYKSLLRKQCNIEVISISEPIMDGPFGSLIERIIEWMDEYYSIRLSGEVRKGMTEKALRGGYQARPPLGYRIDRPKEPPVVVPEEAEIVKLIFNQYVNQRKSFYDIAGYLNQLGLKTSCNNPFEKRSLEYIIQNPTYIGSIRWNRMENETNRMKEEDQWIIAKGQHKAIISQELFEAANARYQKEFTHKRQRPSSARKHWLSGILKCSACGRTLSASSRLDKRYNRNYWSFQCYGYLKGKCTVSHQISQLKVIPPVMASLDNALITGQINYRRKTAPITDEKPDSDLIHQQINKLLQKEARLKEAYLNGTDTLEEYKESKSKLREEEEALKSILQQRKTEIKSAEMKNTFAEPIQNVFSILAHNSTSSEVKKEAIKSIIHKIIYFKEKQEIEVHYYVYKSDRQST